MAMEEVQFAEMHSGINGAMVNSSFMKKNGHHNFRGETNLKERFLQVSSMVLFGSFLVISPQRYVQLDVPVSKPTLVAT